MSFYSNTLFSGITSLHGNKCAQVTINGKFIHVYPMASKSEAGDGLSKFVQDVGILEVIASCGWSPRTGGKEY